MAMLSSPAAGPILHPDHHSSTIAAVPVELFIRIIELAVIGMRCVDRQSLLVLLLTCKTAMAVACPALYELVRLRSLHTLHIFADCLRRSSFNVQWVKGLSLLMDIPTAATTARDAAAFILAHLRPPAIELSSELFETFAPKCTFASAVHINSCGRRWVSSFQRMVEKHGCYPLHITHLALDARNLTASATEAVDMMPALSHLAFVVVAAAGSNMPELVDKLRRGFTRRELHIRLVVTCEHVTAAKELLRAWPRRHRKSRPVVVQFDMHACATQPSDHLSYGNALYAQQILKTVAIWCCNPGGDDSR